MLVRTDRGKPRAWYGTLKECVDELWNRIDFENMKFPDFDFALTEYGGTDFEEAYNHSECWFGVKDFGVHFDADTISVMIAQYGGGCVEAMEITGEFEASEKMKFMNKVHDAVDNYIGEISPDDYVIFEICEKTIY